jgi:hypothetical protein
MNCRLDGVKCVTKPNEKLVRMRDKRSTVTAKLDDFNGKPKTPGPKRPKASSDYQLADIAEAQVLHASNLTSLCGEYCLIRI